MKYTYKQLILILLIVLIVGGVVCSFYLQRKNKILINEIQNSLDSENALIKEQGNINPVDLIPTEEDALLIEKNAVEKYIRDNIGTISTNKPVLGGSWYVLNVIVSPTTGTGEVTYEDGHIQSKANFIYTYKNNGEEILITKFEVLKN